MGQISGSTLSSFFIVACAIFSSPIFAGPNCPARPPCTCDDAARVIRCDEPSLTDHHISFDEIPPFDVSRDTPTWKGLNLSFNVISKVPSDFIKNITVNLHAIYFSNNRISEVGDKSLESSYLDTVDFSYNLLTDVPAAIDRASSITNIDFSFNKIASISGDSAAVLQGIFRLSPHLRINFLGNPFYCDCNIKELVDLLKLNFKKFENPHDLKCVGPLFLEGRVLGALVDKELICPTDPPTTTLGPDHVLPPPCPETRKGCWCDFIGNIYCSKGRLLGNNTVSFTDVPHFVVYSNDYIWNFLYLSGHKIETIKVWAFWPLKLRRLSLTNNKISSIQQGAFDGSEHYLEVLLLEGNQLTTIPEAVMDLKSLTVLDVSLNDIQNVTKDQVSNLHHFTVVDINGILVPHSFFFLMGRNPFHCYCSMWDFHVFVQGSHMHFADLTLMMCVKPDNLATKNIDQLTAEDFTRQPGGCNVTSLPTPDPPPISPDPCPAVRPCWCTFHADVVCSANMLLPTGNNATPPLRAVPHFKMDPDADIQVYETLYLDNNKIKMIEVGAFDGIRVRKIDLQFNEISSIAAGVFKSLDDKLEEIILTGNHLHTVPEAVFPLVFMETLDLSYNFIQYIPPETVKQMRKWRHKYEHDEKGNLIQTTRQKGVQIRVGANHLICDKWMCDLHDWILDDPKDFVDESEVVCVNEKFFNKQLFKLTREELGCVPSVPDWQKQLESALQAKHTLAALFAIAFLICLGLGAYMFYVNKYKSKGIPFSLF